MTDITCWRCQEKLGWRSNTANGVTIKCQNCGAKTQVGLENKSEKSASTPFTSDTSRL